MRLSVTLNPAWRRKLAVDDRRFWLLRFAALQIHGGVNPRWMIEVYYKRLLLLLTTLAVVFYLAAVAGVHRWHVRNPHNQVGWNDLALPWRWSGVRAKIGETAILNAEENIKRGDYLAAYLNLRLGLARAPGHARGRVLLARMQLLREPANALSLMEVGLAFPTADLEFLRNLAAFYQFHQAYARGVATFDRLLAVHAALPPKTRDYLATARVAMLLDGGRLVEAVEALASEPAGGGPDEARVRRLFKLTALTRLGRADEARVLIDQHPMGPASGLTGISAFTGLRRADVAGAALNQTPAESGAPSSEEVGLAIEVAVALDDAERVQSLLCLLKSANPAGPIPYVLAFDCWHRLKRGSLRNVAEAEFFARFGRDDNALQFFARSLVKPGLNDCILRVRHQAVAAGFSGLAYDVCLTESLLRRGSFEEANRLAGTWEKDAAVLDSDRRVFPELVRLLAQAACNSEPGCSQALMKHFEQNRLSLQPALCRFAVDVLVQAGQLDLSDRVLNLGLHRFPFSDPLLAARADLDRQLASARTARPSAAPAGSGERADAAGGSEPVEFLRHVDDVGPRKYLGPLSE